MPVSSEIERTRSAGICFSSQRNTVDLLTPRSAPNCSSVNGGLDLSRKARIGLRIMETNVAYSATSVNRLVAFPANDAQAWWGVPLRMARKPAPPLPFRLHYIREWAAKRGMRQADIVRELDIDKSNVSRWFKGHLPAEENILRLAALFQCEEPAELFRHPDQDWMFRLLRGRSIEEQDRIRATIETAFPQSSAA